MSSRDLFGIRHWTLPTGPVCGPAMIVIVSASGQLQIAENYLAPPGWTRVFAHHTTSLSTYKTIDWRPR